MHHQFNNISREAREHKIEQMLLQHHEDIIRILKRLDQRPREWFGLMPHAADAFDGVTGGADPTCLDNINGYPLDELDEDTAPAYILGISSTGCLVLVPVAECS